MIHALWQAKILSLSQFTLRSEGFIFGVQQIHELLIKCIVIIVNPMARCTCVAHKSQCLSRNGLDTFNISFQIMMTIAAS